MTNTELIKALRDCAATWNTIDDCNVEECPFTAYGSMCLDTMLEAAADALEAADKKIAELEKELEIWSARSFEGKIGSMALVNLNLKMKIYELEAQLLKEGEWIVEEIDDSGFKWCKWRCSVCHEVIKKGWQHTKDGEKPRWKYCPNCGAKMRGE